MRNACLHAIYVRVMYDVLSYLKIHIHYRNGGSNLYTSELVGCYVGICLCLNTSNATEGDGFWEYLVSTKDVSS